MKDTELLAAPVHLECYLRTISIECPNTPIYRKMADLCKAVLLANKSTGMRFESLVAFVLLGRLASGLFDDKVLKRTWLPEDTSSTGTSTANFTIKYNPYITYVRTDDNGDQ